MPRRLVRIVLLVTVIGVGVFALLARSPLIRAPSGPGSVVLIPNPRTPAEKIVNGAKMEVIREVWYDPAYARIPYPNGDVSRDRGACTDVVIRALRNAGFDLQILVHEDMARSFRLYPRKWGLTAPDPNIDHRRVPNLMVFFSRLGRELPVQTRGPFARSWHPGDVVCWDINGNGMTHTGVISNDRGGSGLPMVIHNIGRTTAQTDCLENWKIIGHYRYPR